MCSTPARAVIGRTNSYSRAVLTLGSRRHHDPAALDPDSVALAPPSGPMRKYTCSFKLQLYTAWVKSQAAYVSGQARVHAGRLIGTRASK
jgi:hypothetical protein